MSRTTRSLLAVVALSLAFIVQSADATTYTWDSLGASPANPLDGSGTWDIGSTAWWSTGTSDVTWTNSNDVASVESSALFGNVANGGGSRGTVTVAPATALNVSGITFNATPTGNYTLAGGSGSTITLTGKVGGIINGVTNNASGTTTISENLILDWGNHTFLSPGGGTLALNGSLTGNTGSIAYLGAANVTSGSLTNDAAGLISGFGGAGLISDGTVRYTGLATVSGGAVVPYNYSTDPHAVIMSAAGAIADNATANVEMTNTAQTNFTLGSSTVHLNTIFTNNTTTQSSTTAGTVSINPTANQTLIMGATTGIGGFYVAAAGGTTGNKNLLTLDNATGAKLTAGTGSAPAELIFAVNGSGTSNQMAVNLTVTDNTANGPVTVIKTGSGSMFYAIANSYSGGTYVDQGYIQGNTATSFGSGPVYIAAGATVFPNSTGATFANNFYLSPGLGYPGGPGGYGNMRPGNEAFSGTFTLQGAPGVLIGSGDRISLNNNSATLGVTLSGRITGTGTLELNWKRGPNSVLAEQHNR